MATEFAMKAGEVAGIAVAGAGPAWMGVAVLRAARTTDVTKVPAPA